MGDFTKLEQKVIQWLGNKGKNQAIDFSIFPLTEDDDTQKLRELVHTLEELSDKGYVLLEDDYYVGSDSSVSFKYLNTAIELNPLKVKLSPLGREVFNELIAHPVIERYRIKWGVIISNLVSFILGGVLTYIIFK